MEQTARELIRAVRKGRSQEALSRRLGYRSNPIADWEAGRRFPAASEFVRAAQLCHRPVQDAVATFHPSAAELWTDTDEGIAAWMRALRGNASIGSLASATDRSRYAVARWLSGKTRPRLPDFLRLIEALTGRLSDFVALLVPIERVPSLAERHSQRAASRNVAFDEPWTEAIVRVIETEPYKALSRHVPGVIGAWLGIDLETEERGVQRLLDAGVVRKTRGKLVAQQALTVDTGDPIRTRTLKRHWAARGVERAVAPHDGDLVSYNVVSVSRADLARIREAHIRYFHEVRSIVAASTPVECAALVNIQLLHFSPGEASD